MTWPLSQDYNEAIQDPRNSFSDAELKTGEAVSNALGIPMPRSGNFADVYEVRCPGGGRWAVKCFTREVHGLRERYAEISKYLHQANLPFMVDFKYLEQGIRVRGQWYPILKMQWVEGFLLNEFVRDNLDKKPILQALGQIWLRMAKRLRESYIAHCDLQHGNVLFVPGSKSSSLAVKLIDYDGMCVPSLLGTKSGEVGHPAYQHPERLRSGAYNQEVDRFSLLSIATALRCLTIGGRSLWERYDTGDNLLFRQADLQAPAQSPLFQELMAIGDPQTQALVTELFRACQGPLAAVPLLTDLIPDEKPAVKTTKTVSASSAIAQPVAGAAGPDWDFRGEEPAASVVKKPYKKSGMPLWVWGAMGGAAALLLSVGVGLGLFLKGSGRNEGTPVAQNKPTAATSRRTTKPSTAAQLNPNNGGENPSEPPPVNPPNDNNNPNNANTPQAARPKRIFQLAPGGDKLAMSEDGDKTWKLIDPRTNEVIRTFTGHEGPIIAIAFSADGRRAFTGSEDGGAIAWDLQSGKIIRMLRGPAPVVAVALNADGRKGVLVSPGDVRTRQIWDLDAGSGSFFYLPRGASSFCFSADDKELLAGMEAGDNERDMLMMECPLSVGAVRHAFRDQPGPVICVALSPDGKYAAAVHSRDRWTVTLWEVATEKRLWQRPLSVGSSYQASFSPDGRFLMLGAGALFRFFQVSNGMQVGHMNLPSGTLASACFSSDSKQAVCASHENGKVRLRSLVLAGGAVVSSPSSNPQPAKGWDRPIDPTGDSQFRDDKGKLTITLSRKNHDLSVENNRMTAPRLLRDVEGDFTAEVHITGDFQQNGIQAAGLLLMADDNNYVRLERGRVGSMAAYLWELRRDGKREPTSRIGGLKGLEGYVRLERRGNKVQAFTSDDGEIWQSPNVFDLNLPPKVKIGVAAISVSGTCVATFDRFRLKQGQGDWVGIDKWLAPTGAASLPALSWDAPIDPDGDCKFKQAEGKLTITLPSKLHVLRVEGNGKNTPRLLSDIEGDFTVQVRVGGDFTPAAASSDGGAYSWIGAGLLLWIDENTFFRLERAGYYGRPTSTIYVNWEVREAGDFKRPKLNANLSAAVTYLRLERRDKQIRASYSEDGQRWSKVTSLDLDLPPRVKIGVLAGTSTARPFAPTFDQFQIQQGQGKMVDVDWPSLPGEAAVVVTPPRRPRRPRSANRIPVPAEATLADKKKQLQDMYKDDYKNMPRRGLATRLYEESQQQGELGLRYAMLLESRDLAAQSGDFAAALRAVSRLSELFAADSLELKCQAVEQSLAAITSKTDNRELTQKVLLLVDRALIDERYDLADRLLKVARAAAEKADMSIILKQAVEHSTKQVAALQTEYALVKPAADKLESNPQDAEASLALGKFRCFTREDWDAGLPLLEHGSNSALRELARKELADPTDAGERAKLGDAWYEQAGKAMVKDKTAYLKRAYYWYQEAVDDLDRKDQARVKQQIGKLKTQLPELTRPFADLDFSGPTVSRKPGVSLLHMRPHQVVATRRTFRGPIDIVVTAVLPKGHIRISFLNGGEMTVDPDKNPAFGKIGVYSPFGKDAEERGNLSNTSTVRMGPGPLQEIRMQVRSNGWSNFINGQRGGGVGWSDNRTIDYLPSPVRVWSDDAEIDIKSIVVKPIR